MLPSSSRRCLALTSLLLAAGLARGQSAPAPAPAAGAEEPVTLSPFEVSADANNGYATSSSLTVSRVAAPITEIPVSAIVINEKMIEDTLAVTAEDTFNLVSGLYHGNAGAGNQENNDFSMRGYLQNVAQRDGVDDSLFNSAGGFDYSYIERIEVVKGPNGILYGTTSPGGVINLISKRPTLQPFASASFMEGSFGFYRAAVDTSQFLDKNHEWGFRVSGALANNRGPVAWPGDPRLGFRGINPSLSFRSKSGIEVWLWTAFIRDSSSRAKYITRAFATSSPVSASVAGRTGAPLLDDRPFIDGGAGNNLLHAYSQLNTNSYELGSSKTFELGPLTIAARLIARYREQLNDSSRVRAIGNDIFVNAQGQMIGPANAIDNRFVNLSQVDAPGSIAAVYRSGIQYQKYPVYYTSNTFNFDLNITYQLPWIKSQTLLSGLDEVGKTYTLRDVYQVTTQPALARLGYPVVNGAARIYLYPKSLVNFDMSRETLVNNADTLTHTGGSLSDPVLHRYGFLERLAFWDARFVVVGGASYTIINTKLESSTATGAWGAPVADRDKQWTPGFGAVLKLIHGEKGDVVAFADLNRTFSPVYTNDQRLESYGQKFPDQRAQANEFGIKTDLFKSWVVLTASYFNTKESDVLLSYVDDAQGTVTGVPNRSYSAPGGTRINRGFEADVNVKITRSLEVVMGYGTIHSELATTHLPQEAMPLDTASALAHYRFDSGWTKGFSLTYAYNHWGKSYLGGGNRTTWIIPGGNMHTAILGYHWRNYDIRLRVQNLFDVRDPQPSDFDTGVGVTNPRSYRLGFSTKF